MQVDFHSGVTDKVGHACRLLRKAVRQGARVQVCGEPAELDALDQAEVDGDALGLGLVEGGQQWHLSAEHRQAEGFQRLPRLLGCPLLAQIHLHQQGRR